MNDITTDRPALDQAIRKKVLDFCEQGYILFDDRDYKAAIRQFYMAWNELPKPQTNWEESGWVLTALGDAYVAKGDFTQAQNALTSALHCPKAKGNPTIHLRLGQCLYELGDVSGATEQFIQVLEYGGQDMLMREEEKYRVVVENRLEK